MVCITLIILVKPNSLRGNEIIGTLPPGFIPTSTRVGIPMLGMFNQSALDIIAGKATADGNLQISWTSQYMEGYLAVPSIWYRI